MADLKWYELQGVTYKLTRFQREGTKTGIYVKNGTKSSYMGINSQEYGSFIKIARDCNLDFKEVDEPIYEKAPCLVNVTKLHRHVNICGKCKTITGGKVDRQGVSRNPKTVITVKGLHSFNLEGMLSVMKEHYDLLEIIREEYRSMMEMIERFPQVVKEYEDAQKNLEDHKTAVQYFWKEGDNNAQIEMDQTPKALKEAIENQK